MSSAATHHDDHPDSTVPAGYALDVDWDPEWIHDPNARQQRLAEVERRNRRLYRQCIATLALWREEIRAASGSR